MKELLDIRKRFNRYEKTKFLNIVEKKLSELGYETERKKFVNLLVSENLETKNNNPEYIFIAHYDTGTIMPFWMNWLMKLIGVNRQILMIVFTVGLISYLIPFVEGYDPFIGRILSLIFVISLLLAFIPNRRNLDDNTSGVIALLNLAKRFKEEGLDNAKFVFVDNEELGLFGSSAHKRYLERNSFISKSCKVISIDCVGGSGKTPLIIRNSKSDYASLFQDAIGKGFDKCEMVKMLLPASDNYSFKRYGAINISFVDKTIIPNGYYIKDIHSHKDKKINLEKIDKLCNIITETVVNAKV
ncbi:MAG: M28 family peptidase [Bacteroidales bacterium]|nr:M28 family peptidase [Bacteroidales bacterium]